MDNNQTLADLRFLLDFGFLTEKCVISTDKGEFRFELKTITPLEEVEANQVVATRLAQSGNADDAAKNIQTAIELLARCIVSVNGVNLEDHPHAKGDSALQRKRNVVSKFSEKLMLPLWQTYQKLKTNVASEAEGDSDELKKS